MVSLIGNDPEMLVWWGARVECVSALAVLNSMSGRWHEVIPAGVVRRRAAAITVADTGPSQFEFVSLDQRLNEAAQREGLRVITG